MEAVKQPDYRERAEQTYEAVQALLKLSQNPEIKELGLDLEAEKNKAERGLRRAQLLTKLKDATGFNFAVYEGSLMPGAAGFVKTNGEQTIYIAEHTLDEPAFADHVAKHEAYHLKTMLFLPVETDFSAEHFLALNLYLPEKFENNEFYLEGFNEWLTANHDEQGEEVTAYGAHVAAAKQLEALAYGATGESLMNCFETGDSLGFARILKTTTDRLMLHEALEAGEYEDSEKAALRPFIKLYPEPVASPEKAEVIIESWSAKMKADKLKELLLNGEMDELKETIESQRAKELISA
ncbi:hypothetical protein GW756_02040 [bacterium]|nr:hypothetical protein [bacterium]NCQ55573.1 hypothetical protein [Candidatus Parcubacteria bacterium]NCS67398.1 hypothetical protein [Candidatus Peregrinibacteria bacterium]NCS96124.1 hypothetical protein [bacterium]